MLQINNEFSTNPVCIKLGDVCYYLEATGNDTYTVYGPDGQYVYESKDELIQKFGKEAVEAKSEHIRMSEQTPKIIGMPIQEKTSEILSKSLDLLTVDIEKQRHSSTLVVALKLPIVLHINKRAQDMFYEIDGLIHTLVFRNKNDILHFVGDNVDTITFIDRKVYSDTTVFDPEGYGYKETVIVSGGVWL